MYAHPAKVQRSKGRVHIFRGMRTAPVEGYRAQVALDPSQQGGHYFFCNVDGLYGKGWITTPKLRRWKNRRIIYANMEIRLNPGGSRNIASVD